MKNLLIASIAAIVIQPLVLLLVYALDILLFYNLDQLNQLTQIFSSSIFVYILAVAAVMVLILGIPVFLMLKKFNRESMGSLTIVGALLGALPVAFFWPSYLEGWSSGQSWHGKYV